MKITTPIFYSKQLFLLLTITFSFILSDAQKNSDYVAATDWDILFAKNHISLLLMPSFNGKPEITKDKGKYILKSESQPGITAGFSYHSNFAKYYSFITGIHFSVTGRDEVFFIPKIDLNRDFDVFEDGKTSQEYDLVHVGIPFCLEKRWFNSNEGFLNLIMGISLRYSLQQFDEQFEAVYESSDGSYVNFYNRQLNLGNKGKPWVDYNIGGGYSWILPNNNIFRLNILINFSNTRFVDGSYQFTVPGQPITEGRYRIKNSFMGVSIGYLFTKTNKKPDVFNRKKAF
jgi:hypothetical protein